MLGDGETCSTVAKRRILANTPTTTTPTTTTTTTTATTTLSIQVTPNQASNDVSVYLLKDS